MVTSEAVPFVYLASVCRSLQCLVSALTQAGRGGLLFRFACSVMLCRGRGTADKCHWCVWEALAVFQPHWVCPHSQRVCFPRLHCSGSSLFNREWALSGMRFQFSGTPQKHRLGWAFVLCLPRPSSSGSQELDGRTLPGCGALHPLHGPSLSVHAHRSSVPCVCSGELVSSRDPPSRCQTSGISGSLWLETGSLFAVW